MHFYSKYDRCRPHWVAVPVEAGCSPALAPPVFVTVTVCCYVGFVPWPRSPGRTLWRGWSRPTPGFHSAWNTVLFFAPLLTDTHIQYAWFNQAIQLPKTTEKQCFGMFSLPVICLQFELSLLKRMFLKRKACKEKQTWSTHLQYSNGAICYMLTFI